MLNNKYKILETALFAKNISFQKKWCSLHKHKQPKNKQKTNAYWRDLAVINNQTVYLFTIPVTLTCVTKAL